MLNLIWDLDGTLVDSEAEVLYNLELALLDAGVDLRSRRAELRVGPTIDVMLRAAFSSEAMPDELLSDVIRHFRSRYDNSSFELTRAFVGIDEIVRDCNRFRNYLVTNKPDFPTARIIAKMGWGGLFRTILTPYTASAAAPSSSKKKTKEELFREIVDRATTSEAAFVGIGDMASDCIAAQKCGIEAVGVLWGTGTEPELRESGCGFLVQDCAGLMSALGTIEGRASR